MSLEDDIPADQSTLRKMDERAAKLSREDRMRAVLHAVWLTLTYDAHRTPGGYLTEEGERFLRAELDRAL